MLRLRSHFQCQPDITGGVNKKMENEYFLRQLFTADGTTLYHQKCMSALLGISPVRVRGLRARKQALDQEPIVERIVGTSNLPTPDTTYSLLCRQVRG